MRAADGGPAFPCEWLNDGEITGMTLRDYFAAKALVGICSALVQGARAADVPKVAADAYFLADAMLKARAQ